jgi:hypothetical protein
VSELLVRYLQFANTCYVKNGVPTGEVENIKAAIGPLRILSGQSFADEFGPKALKRVRQYMIDVQNLSRGVINNRIDSIKRVFRCGVGEELLPPSVDQALRTVGGLRSGRCNARPKDHCKRKCSRARVGCCSSTRTTSIPNAMKSSD